MGVIAALFFAARTPFAAKVWWYVTRHEMSVTIVEGATTADIDAQLAGQGITSTGTFAAIANDRHDEGYLFPDTYRFFTGSDPRVVEQTMRKNFDTRTKELLTDVPVVDVQHAVIVASLLEREVTDQNDRRLVAGILEKRLTAGKPLQVDATICYIKREEAHDPHASCYPLSALDLRIDSPYNTYLYKGLPPGPIGNPGIDALTAARTPLGSPYWFYLTDPATKRTIFSATATEHEHNRAQYLGS